MRPTGPKKMPTEVTMGHRFTWFCHRDHFKSCRRQCVYLVNVKFTPGEVMGYAEVFVCAISTQSEYLYRTNLLDCRSRAWLVIPLCPFDFRVSPLDKKSFQEQEKFGFCHCQTILFYVRAPLEKDKPIERKEQ